MNRYWLFAGSQYYPSGGLLDLIGTYATREEIVVIPAEGNKASTLQDFTIFGEEYNWYHVFDAEQGKVVEHDGDTYRWDWGYAKTLI